MWFILLETDWISHRLCSDLGPRNEKKGTKWIMIIIIRVVGGVGGLNLLSMACDSLSILSFDSYGDGNSSRFLEIVSIRSDKRIRVPEITFSLSWVTFGQNMSGRLRICLKCLLALNMTKTRYDQKISDWCYENKNKTH